MIFAGGSREALAPAPVPRGYERVAPDPFAGALHCRFLGHVLGAAGRVVPAAADGIAIPRD